MELATNAESAAQFVVGIMPPNLERDLNRITSVAPPETSTELIPFNVATAMDKDELIAKIKDGAKIAGAGNA
jgi:hypothetical protein